MSRCFPYRPTICRREDVSLIGSIKKLQNDKRDAKQKDSRVNDVNESRKRAREELGRADRLVDNKKRRYDGKLMLSESIPAVQKLVVSDNFESSGLSEEHDPPAFVVNPSSSSESTQNNKRNGLADPEPKKKSQSLVLRFKLPLRKCKDPEPPSRSTVACCSSQALRSSNIQGCSGKSDLGRKELPSSKHSGSEKPSFSGRSLGVPSLDEDIARGASGHQSRRSAARCFRDLISSWKPIPIESQEAIPIGDQEWLFTATKQKTQREEAGAHNSQAGGPEPASCPSAAASLQLRACYLPELDMYQLPYVVPF